VKICLRKIGLRKKRAAFAVVSVALGVVVLVTVSSLVDGIRSFAQQTMWSEDVLPDTVMAFSTDNPYEYFQPNADLERKRPTRRFQFLSEDILKDWRSWGEVAGAERKVMASPVGFRGLDGAVRLTHSLIGAPEGGLRRHAQVHHGVDDFVPVVLGEGALRLWFVEGSDRYAVASESEMAGWVGREIELVVGDNFVNVSRFQRDSDTKKFVSKPSDEWERERLQLEEYYRSNYDLSLFGTTLRVPARVVGILPGRQALAPQESVEMFSRWLEHREQLARLAPTPRAVVDVQELYERRGRRKPQEGEFMEAIVWMKEGADEEVVAKRIEELGFSVTTRDRVFDGQMKMFDSQFNVVRKVAYWFGAVLLGLACGLVWSTTSKVVADSRVDIGLFRALGATKRDIRRLFLGESVLLGLMGLAAGILLGWVLALGISRWAISFSRAEMGDMEELALLPDSIFAVNVEVCLILTAGVVLVSLLAGLWPANRAANIDPVRALKRE
jgi:hypothetical protein